MNPYYPLCKGTILVSSGPSEHLFFICNDPVFYPKQAIECFLAVNLSSIKPLLEHDQTCTLDKGDHPFIQHPSYVVYKKAEIFGEVTVKQKVAAGEIRTHQPCNDAIFQRVLDGFKISPHVTPKIKKFYEKYCIAP